MINVRETTAEERLESPSMIFVTEIMEDKRYYTKKALEELYRKIGESLSNYTEVITKEDTQQTSLF